MNIDIDIVNRALEKAGQEKLKTTPATNDASRYELVKSFYLQTILETLANAEWTSQKTRARLEVFTKTATLTQNTSAASLSGYSYIYDLPADFSSVVQLNSGSSYKIVDNEYLYCNDATASLEYIANMSDYEYRYKLPEDCAKPVELADKSEYIVEGRYLYTNSEKAILVYVSNGYSSTVVSEDDDYPYYNELAADPLLFSCIESRLAAKLAMKITGNQTLFTMLYSEASAIERSAIMESGAHSANKQNGDKYWGDILGLSGGLDAVD